MKVNEMTIFQKNNQRCEFKLPNGRLISEKSADCAPTAERPRGAPSGGLFLSEFLRRQLSVSYEQHYGVQLDSTPQLSEAAVQVSPSPTKTVTHQKSLKINNF